VLEYKAAADVTASRKRDLEEGDEEKPKPKKIKVKRKTFSLRLTRGGDKRHDVIFYS
jgi:hypothetical protein